MNQFGKTLLLLTYLFLIINISACGQNENERKYDFIIASGNGYNLVASLRAGEGNSDMVGVIDDKGNWIHELSESNPIIEDGRIQRVSQSIAVFVFDMSVEQQQIARDGVRRIDIINDYRHYEDAIFELINVTTWNDGRVTYDVILRYDARNNVLVE